MKTRLFFAAVLSLATATGIAQSELYPKHFEAVSHQTPRLPFSDHYPVVAEINF